MDIAKKAQLAEWFRKFTLFAVSLSAISMFTAMIAVPMTYTYLQRTQSMLEDELRYCQAQTNTLWEQFYKVTLFLRKVLPWLAK